MEGCYCVSSRARTPQLLVWQRKFHTASAPMHTSGWLRPVHWNAVHFSSSAFGPKKAVRHTVTLSHSRQQAKHVAFFCLTCDRVFEPTARSDAIVVRKALHAAASLALLVKSQVLTTVRQSLHLLSMHLTQIFCPHLTVRI